VGLVDESLGSPQKALTLVSEHKGGFFNERRVNFLANGGGAILWTSRGSEGACRSHAFNSSQKKALWGGGTSISCFFILPEERPAKQPVRGIAAAKSMQALKKHLILRNRRRCKIGGGEQGGDFVKKKNDTLD